MTRSWSKNRCILRILNFKSDKAKQIWSRVGENVLSNMMANMPLRIFLTLQQRYFSLLSSQPVKDDRAGVWRSVPHCCDTYNLIDVPTLRSDSRQLGISSPHSCCSPGPAQLPPPAFQPTELLKTGCLPPGNCWRCRFGLKTWESRMVCVVR